MNDVDAVPRQPILYASEFREDQLHDVRLVSAFARAMGQPITLLHVLESLWHFSNPVLELSFCQHQQQLARGRADVICRSFELADVECSSSLIRSGSVVEEICSAAAESGAEVIALGAGDVELRGSPGVTALAVMEAVSQSVLVMRPRPAESGIRTIVCPIDQSRVSRCALEQAIRLARGSGARLIVLSVIPEVSWLTAAAETGELKDAKLEFDVRWAEGVDQFLESIDFQGVTHEHLLVRGLTHEEILRAAREDVADLIVMGATGRSGLVRVLLGSTTRRVLRELPCSLLAVREPSV
ncbi:MAG: universal stress protein [Planctomycetota bacterium]